jgi:hypothetical protein
MRALDRPERPIPRGNKETTMMKLRLIAVALTALISVSAGSIAHAQDKMGTNKKMSSKKATAKKMDKSVAVCEKCKTAMSAADASKMMNKDAMGHDLKKMDKMPKGYKMESMGKMDGDKMGMDKNKMGEKGKM